MSYQQYQNTNPYPSFPSNPNEPNQYNWVQNPNQNYGPSGGYGAPNNFGNPAVSPQQMNRTLNINQVFNPGNFGAYVPNQGSYP